MNAVFLQRLMDYNYWAHKRVWECVLDLSEEQFRQPSDYSIGSVHDQVVHTLEVEWVMYQRAHGISPESLAPTETYPTREAIRARWDEIEAAWRAYAANVTDAELAEVIEYRPIKDVTNDPRRIPRWLLIQHCLNHSTDHRAQTLAQIHAVGGATVSQDIIFYSWEI
jgi:uncharacterized damage-inducible protein DinB